MLRPGALLLLVLASVLSSGAVGAAEPPVEIRAGERIVFVGAADVERWQLDGYLETLLTTAVADRQPTFRNLGWSGDTVWGEARAVFGAPNDGFERLRRDLATAAPTLIVACYGGNEAFAGPARLPAFRTQLGKLLEMFEKTGARVVLLAPAPHEPTGRPELPDPAPYNARLAEYVGVLREVAGERGHAVVDPGPLCGRAYAAGEAIPPVDRLTLNGIHPTDYGRWRAAPVLAAALGVAVEPWTLAVDAAASRMETAGVAVTELAAKPGEVRFQALSAALPYPPPPPHSPAGALDKAPARTLQVTGLAPGRYRLVIDDQEVAHASAAEWAAGVRLAAGPEFEQVEQLRRHVIRKDEFFFHRHRPQNETYLFLFRKHEQGNNAVEIPQFDPLIAAEEARIAELSRPQKHVYRLIRSGE